MTNRTKKPAHKVKFGGIEVTVWENTSKEGEVFHSLNLRRSYMGKDGNWGEQNLSLSFNDAMKVIGALTKAQMDYHSLPQFQNPEHEAT